MKLDLRNTLISLSLYTSVENAANRADNPGAHAQRGLQYLVCVSVCLSATILGLQATGRLMSDTNSFSATRA